ncbi:hypothetical protein Salat_1165800 [Sesamum alatum]|uniref:Uncharacterized protein n=1 Tax=Sesamum alatum TaxID=300844 RepID=A0AAE2CNH2_9LAMI|nr:hypothetical protein Salat_1165800 [Sesamum alatum]
MSDRGSGSNGNEQRTWGMVKWPPHASCDAENLPGGGISLVSKDGGGRGGDKISLASQVVQAEAKVEAIVGRGGWSRRYASAFSRPGHFASAFFRSRRLASTWGRPRCIASACSAGFGLGRD